jgi:hypothetical protein
MDRASGVYKRNAKGVAFLIGLVVAAISNADTFHIVSRLSNDDALQKTIIDGASQAVRNPQDLATLKTQANRALADTALPIGWTSANACQQSGYDLGKRNAAISIFQPLDLTAICSNSTDTFAQPETQSLVIPTGDQRGAYILHRLPGWVLSALATTMGAPFWFEILSRFINIRNTGRRPASSTDTSTAVTNNASSP